MMISYGRQNINQADIDAVVEVLQSDWLTQGPTIERFEKDVAAYCGAKFAVAVSNATAALHIACLAAGLKKGYCLWTVPNTFVASANCGRYCGADIDFIDIDDRTYNMDVDKLEEKLANGTIRPKIVIPVHFAGQSCDMKRIHALAQQYDFTVIEDASHAIGSDYQGAKVGSGMHSDMTVFSFHPVKIVTTAEGGMVLTNREDLYEKLRLYRSHGITRDTSLMKKESEGPWYYEQIALGFNYRMTDLQAALGISQMKRIDQFVNKRRALVDRYNERLKDSLLQLPLTIEAANPSWHLYVVRAKFDTLKIDKRTLFSKMRERGVALNVHYIPVHVQPDYQELGFRQGDFPVCEQYYKEAFTLPLYYDLTADQQDDIVKNLKELLC